MTENPLQPILDRIHEPWWSGISCGEGWHGFLLELDARLASMDPDYTIQQVKEKFGTLRYYASPSEAYRDSNQEAYQKYESAFQRAIRAAELKSSTTCENCGAADGSLKVREGAWRTLCGACGDKMGFRAHSMAVDDE